jgi:plasmid stabilization system protein ParE
MTFSVHLRPKAEQDLWEAATWYEEQRIDLGNQFLDEALAVFSSIAETPFLYPNVYRNIRRSLIRRFPFGVYYCIEEKKVVVVAVMHGSRDPRQWKKRK